MMDRLDEVAAAAGALLRQVDGTIASAGAPAGHPLWTEVRRVRLLPTDAVHAVAALRPADLADAAPRLRRQARQYADMAASLPPPQQWTGQTADAYDLGRRRLTGHLSDDPDSLAERLEASADLGDALVDWMLQARTDVAGALAEVLGSAEAVVLAGADLDGARPVPQAVMLAAAEIGARLLRAVADAYEMAEDLLDGSADLATASVIPARDRIAWPEGR